MFLDFRSAVTDKNDCIYLNLHIEITVSAGHCILIIFDNALADNAIITSN